MRYRIDDVERSYYRILDVDQQASLDQIRAAHRRLARILHPDKQAGRNAGERELAERRMREVNEAWTVLSDPGTRADYDEALRRAEFRTTADRVGGDADGPGGRASDGSGSGRGDRSLSDNFDNSDPAYARAFNHGAGNGGLFDESDLRGGSDGEDDGDDAATRRRRNVRGAMVALAVVLVAGAFLVVTAYAGGVDGEDVPRSVVVDPLTTIRNPVSSTVGAGD